MLTVNLHITEGPVSRDVRVRASSLASALRLAGRGRPGVKVELRGPLVPVTVHAANRPKAPVADVAA